jgi:calcium release-activated calcium channel protein 1
MVEAEVNEKVSPGLLIAFSVCTTLVVTVHLLALMISTCILPNIEAVSNVHNVSAISESVHDKMHWYIEMAWIFSTGIGILLFMTQMAMLAWVRFQPINQTNAALASTVIIVPAIVVFMAFAIHFYRQLIAHRYERSTAGLEELETMASELGTGNFARSQTNANALLKVV